MDKNKWGRTGWLVTGSYYKDRPVEMHEVEIDKVTDRCVFADHDVFHPHTGIQISDVGDKCRLFPDFASAREYTDRTRLIRQLDKYVSSDGEMLARKMPFPKLKKLIEIFESEENR